MHVRDLMAAMEVIAPLSAAEPWDNVGLILGDPAAPLARVLLCIDLTAAIVEEARRKRCEAVVAYHPPIFKEVRKIAAGTVVFDAVRHGLAVYSPHTALDVAEDGTNDTLADALGLTRRQPLRPSAPAEDYRLVVFVPPEALAKVTEALFAAGAGKMGDYRECAFRVTGTGTFYGEEGANPAVGRKGRRETVEEVRLETVVPASRAAEVVAAMRQAHPYEEPAFDLLRRAAPGRGGLGRIGDFEEPVARDLVLERIKEQLDLGHMLVAGPLHGMIRRAACCAGSCGELMDLAAAQGAQLYLTGELKHHDALRAARLGMTAVCVLHSNSERAVLKRLSQRLVETLAGVDVTCSEADCDPFAIV